jgi:outer membrane phospholipase A
MKYIFASVCMIFSVLLGGSSNAAEEKKEQSRFMPNETEASYLVAQQAAGDETALRARYSFKYCLFNFYSSTGNSSGNAREPSNSCRYGGAVDSSVYFSYTGEFDFYARTRPSDPVINRLSNPALHWQIKQNYLSLLERNFKWIDIAFEHRSNGQVTEVSTPQEAAKAQLAYSSNDHVYFDSISRGSNYFSLNAMIESADTMIDYSAKIKKYVSQSSEITWGPLAGSNTSIADYDRVKLLFQYRTNTKSEYSVEWTIGDQGLSTDSVNISFLPNKDWPLPIYIRYHSGPMHTLSNYTENQSYMGIGFEFIP